MEHEKIKNRIDELFDMGLEEKKKVGADKVLIPTMFINVEKEESMIVCMVDMPKDHSQKVQCMAQIGNKFAKKGKILEAFFVTEIWMKQYEREDYKKAASEAKKSRIKDTPGRTEAMLGMYRNCEGEVTVKIKGLINIAGVVVFDKDIDCDSEKMVTRDSLLKYVFNPELILMKHSKN